MNKVTAAHQTFNIFKDTYQHLRASSNDPQNLDSEKMAWADAILQRFNLELVRVGEVRLDPSTLFVGNHISYLDIPLLLSTIPGLSFVAKQEVSNWPLFGSGARKLDTVFVKRSKNASRKNAAEAIKANLIQGKRIALFPSGTTSIDSSKAWRKGSFELAASTNSWVQPFRISYSPLRAVAYIDDDFFPTHLFRLFSSGKIDATLEFHEPVKIKDPLQDCLAWQAWAQQATGQGPRLTDIAETSAPL